MRSMHTHGGLPPEEGVSEIQWPCQPERRRFVLLVLEGLPPRDGVPVLALSIHDRSIGAFYSLIIPPMGLLRNRAVSIRNDFVPMVCCSLLQAQNVDAN